MFQSRAKNIALILAIFYLITLASIKAISFSSSPFKFSSFCYQDFIVGMLVLYLLSNIPIF